MSTTELLQRLECNRGGCECHRSASRGYGKTHCPNHEDKDPSLSLSEKNGTTLWKCHSGCTKEAVTAALRELSPRETAFKDQIVATYDYRDAAGQLLYQTVRFQPKNFRQRKPDGKGGWEWSLNGTSRVLYRLPELLAQPDGWVFLVEGEKDADRLRQEGLLATCYAGGAKATWNRGFSESLRGRSVAILCDADEAGIARAQRDAQELRGFASEIRVLELPGLERRASHGQDVSDWLDLDNTVEDLKRLVLEVLPEPVQRRDQHRPETPPAAELDNFHCTDFGNSERLALWHGNELRHVPAWGWLVWDGRRWSRSDKLAAELGKRTVRQIYRSATESPDETRRKELSKHATLSESRHRIAAMLALAESDPKIRAEPGDFDSDPMALNVGNGTIDLRTGQLREHRREDLHTKLVELDYLPEATSDLWEKFLVEATAGKDGLADFLRRAAGYTLTGSTQEDAIFVSHGPGGTGKTTFVETLKTALGPYAGSVRIEVLTMSARASGGHNEDIARLVGRRMVTAVEASEDERLREGQVKHMTGGDTIPASLKHRPAFDFTPVFKLWFATNEMPYIRADDTGMWRRVHKLPFENRHSTTTSLKEQLRNRKHLAAVLTWAVRGCLEWQQLGLQVPACVGDATAQLRRHMDGGLEHFLTEHCEFGGQYVWTMTRDIRRAYTSWASEHGIPEARRASEMTLAKTLRRRGCEPEQRRLDPLDPSSVRGWWGISVLDRPTCPTCPASSQFFQMYDIREEKVASGGTAGTAGTNGNGKPPLQPTPAVEKSQVEL